MTFKVVLLSALGGLVVVGGATLLLEDPADPILINPITGNPVRDIENPFEDLFDGTPDLFLADLQVTPAAPRHGEPIVVTATVRNTGDGKSAATEVVLRLPGSDPVKVVAPPVRRGESVTVTFPTVHATFGLHELRAELSDGRNATLQLSASPRGGPVPATYRTCDRVVTATNQPVGNGAALLAAWNETAAAGGGILCLEVGTYDLPAPLRATPGTRDITLAGSGGFLDGSKIRNGWTGVQPVLFDLRDTTGIVLQNVRFDPREGAEVALMLGRTSDSQPGGPYKLIDVVAERATRVTLVMHGAVDVYCENGRFNKSPVGAVIGSYPLRPGPVTVPGTPLVDFSAAPLASHDLIFVNTQFGDNHGLEVTTTRVGLFVAGLRDAQFLGSLFQGAPVAEAKLILDEITDVHFDQPWFDSGGSLQGMVAGRYSPHQASGAKPPNRFTVEWGRFDMPSPADPNATAVILGHTRDSRLNGMMVNHAEVNPIVLQATTSNVTVVNPVYPNGRAGRVLDSGQGNRACWSDGCPNATLPPIPLAGIAPSSSYIACTDPLTEGATPQARGQALLAAWNAAVAFKRGEVCLAPGDYVLPSPLQAHGLTVTGLAIVGQGGGAPVRILAGWTGEREAVVDLEGSSHVRLENVEVDARKAARYAIKLGRDDTLRSAGHMVIRGVAAGNATVASLYSFASEYGYFQDCAFTRSPVAAFISAYRASNPAGLAQKGGPLVNFSETPASSGQGIYVRCDFGDRQATSRAALVLVGAPRARFVDSAFLTAPGAEAVVLGEEAKLIRFERCGFDGSGASAFVLGTASPKYRKFSHATNWFTVVGAQFAATDSGRPAIHAANMSFSMWAEPAFTSQGENSTLRMGPATFTNVVLAPQGAVGLGATVRDEGTGNRVCPGAKCGPKT